jgi:Phospholipase_D-nuclease N-terminal
MNRTKKNWLGILSFLPIIVGIFAIIYMFTNFLPEILKLERMGEEPDPLYVFSKMGPFIALIILSALLHLGLLIFFIIHAINNKQVKSEERIIWILVFIFVSSIGFPIYWGLRIWPEPKPLSNFVRE